REPKIDKLHSISSKNDAGGVQIPMHQPFSVRLVESVSHGHSDLQALFQLQWAMLQPLCQRFSFDKLTHNVSRLFVASDFIDGRNVRMLQRSKGSRILFQ